MPATPFSSAAKASPGSACRIRLSPIRNAWKPTLRRRAISSTDRAKLGWKWSVLTDKVGIPFGWTADGANRNDSVLLAPTLEDAERRGLTEEIETIWLDRGYDSDADASPPLRGEDR